MKKLASLMVSLIVLTLSGMRSAQAQGLLTFSPPTSKANSVTSQSKITPSVTGTSPKKSAAIGFQAPARPAQSPETEGVKRPKALPQASVVTNNALLDVCRNCGNDQNGQSAAQSDDRLVAVAPDELFEGGSDSLVAKAVGSAEGTRTPDGSKTWAYKGHVDPGNGVWNVGSFSYQHGADSPDDADRRQLARLRNQYAAIERHAISAGLRLGLEEQLNGIDLANQAPLAALEEGGYVDRLRQAYTEGLRGSEAVLHARTYSYLDPRTNQWDAPGLGNNYYSIKRDQARRQDAIYQAIQSHQQMARSLKRSDDIRVSRNN
ncbi:hypothetical protein NC981_01205 [Leptolyngbya sp. DQ-M1]|uniref:hypothetical protein n=1 Tax=Leptolyngbya sp. DQ-M1 TaxID=2933920 RepID=UPI003299923F